MNAKQIAALIGTFLAGAFSGIAGTYIYMKNVYCDKMIDEGIQDYILHRYDVETGEVINDEDGEDEENNGDNSQAFKKNVVPKYQTPLEDQVKYNEFYEKKSPQDILAENEHPLDGDEEDKDEEELMEDVNEEERENYLNGLNESLEHAAYSKGDLNPVEIIDKNSFGNNPEYDDVVLIYWLGDDTISDELEEPLHELLTDSLFNYAITKTWVNEANRHPDTTELYVRHHEFKKDYKIITDSRGYLECH